MTEPFAINGVVRWHSSDGAGHDAPRVAITGSVHGNEPCGLRAIERIEAELASAALRLRRGTLYLVHGNPRATALCERHTPQGVDLNRLFDYRFQRDLPSAAWAYEHYRALELRPLLETVDVLLDLHSTSAPSPPFAIVSALPAARALAAGLGVPYVTDGWDAPGLLADRVISAPLLQRARPAVSVECGQHGDQAAAEVAYDCIRRCLDQLGLLAFPERGPCVAATWLRLRAAVKRPSADFRFVRPLMGMQQLAAGQLIGTDADLALSAQRQCYVIMPNDTVAVGDDMIYIAQPVAGCEADGSGASTQGT